MGADLEGAVAVGGVVVHPYLVIQQLLAQLPRTVGFGSRMRPDCSSAWSLLTMYALPTRSSRPSRCSFSP